MNILCSPRRRRFAGAERGSRVSQFALNLHCKRVRAAEHAPRDPFRVLERCHGFAEISECGAVGFVERLRVNPPHPERESITLSENASRHGDRFAKQFSGFFEAL